MDRGHGFSEHHHIDHRFPVHLAETFTLQHAIEKNQSLSGSFDQTSVANWIANGAGDIDSFTQFVLSNASQYRRDIVNEKFN